MKRVLQQIPHHKETSLPGKKKTDTMNEHSVVDEFKDLDIEDSNVPKRPSTAFTVLLDDKQRATKNASRSRTAPARLSKPTQESLMDYSHEESLMMAEIVREARLNDVREKAKYVDVKLYDAQRRRMFHDYRKEQLQKIEAEKKTSDAAERRKIVKQMADETRRKAAHERLFRQKNGKK